MKHNLKGTALAVLQWLLI